MEGEPGKEGRKRGEEKEWNEPLFRRRFCLSACLVSSLLVSIEQDGEKSWNGKKPPNTIHFSQNTHLSIYLHYLLQC